AARRSGGRVRGAGAVRGLTGASPPTTQPPPGVASGARFGARQTPSPGAAVVVPGWRRSDRRGDRVGHGLLAQGSGVHRVGAGRGPAEEVGPALIGVAARTA